MAFLINYSNCEYYSDKYSDSSNHIYLTNCKYNQTIMNRSFKEGFYKVDKSDEKYIPPSMYNTFTKELMDRLGYKDREDILYKTRNRKIRNISTDTKRKRIFSEFLIPTQDVDKMVFENKVCKKIFKDFQSGYSMVNKDDSNFTKVYEMFMECFRKCSENETNLFILVN